LSCSSRFGTGGHCQKRTRSMHPLFFSTDEEKKERCSRKRGRQKNKKKEREEGREQSLFNTFVDIREESEGGGGIERKTPKKGREKKARGAVSLDNCILTSAEKSGGQGGRKRR